MKLAMDGFDKGDSTGRRFIEGLEAGRTRHKYGVRVKRRGKEPRADEMKAEDSLRWPRRGLSV